MNPYSLLLAGFVLIFSFIFSGCSCGRIYEQKIVVQHERSIGTRVYELLVVDVRYHESGTNPLQLYLSGEFIGNGETGLNAICDLLEKRSMSNQDTMIYINQRIAFELFGPPGTCQINLYLLDMGRATDRFFSVIAKQHFHLSACIAQYSAPNQLEYFQIAELPDEIISEAMKSGINFPKKTLFGD